MYLILPRRLSITHRSVAMLNVGLLRGAEHVYWPQITSSFFLNEGFRSANRYKFSLEPRLFVRQP